MNTTLDSDAEGLAVSAIVYEQGHFSPRRDPELVCKAMLRHGTESLEPGAHGDKLVYGNSRGHGLLEDMSELRRRVDILLSRVDTQATDIVHEKKRGQERDAEILSLRGQVTRLSQSAKDYLAIRRRFLAVYERDYKGKEELRGSDVVKEGNLKAHGGDAAADATVFERDARTDINLYKELYGLDHTKVLELTDSGLDDGGLLRVLNTYATLLTQGRSSKELTRAFDCFIARVKETWFQPPNKEHNTPLGWAYWDFWKCHKEYKPSQSFSI